jgi:CDP-diglyceride synthetase
MSKSGLKFVVLVVWGMSLIGSAGATGWLAVDEKGHWWALTAAYFVASVLVGAYFIGKDFEE